MGEAITAKTGSATPETRVHVDTDMVHSFITSMHSASENTRSAYRAALSLAAQIKLTIDEDTLKVFAANLAKRKFAKATQQLYIAALRRLLEWLDANDKLPAGLNRSKAEARFRVARGSSRSGYRHRLADNRLPQIIQHYDEQELPALDRGTGRKRLELLRSRAIMHTLYASGGRVSEIASLTRGQVADGNASEVLITGKGSKERMLFLTPEAQSAIKIYCRERSDSHPALFISHGRGAGQPLSRVSIWRAVKAAAKAQGLSAITSPHSFRHYRATQLLNEGMPLESVQAYLGHASPATTRVVYAHTKTAVLKDQLRTYGLAPKDALRSKIETD